MTRHPQNLSAQQTLKVQDNLRMGSMVTQQTKTHDPTKFTTLYEMENSQGGQDALRAPGLRTKQPNLRNSNLQTL
jgi:ABC-type branched-subunit amino acid transport system ATPase component